MKFCILLEAISTMLVCRPSQDIRVKALGLHWRGDDLPAAKVENDHGNIKGVRPLGGSLDFGDSWQQALTREFMEELGIEVSSSNPPIVLENIYEHHDMTGHRVLFIPDVIFPADAFEGQGMINFSEDDGTNCNGRWFNIHRLGGNGLALFPTGLKEVLLKRDIQKAPQIGAFCNLNFPLTAIKRIQNE